MIYQEEKLRKIIKIALIVLGVLLLIGLFNLFNGKNSTQKKYTNNSLGSKGGVMMGGGAGLQSPMATDSISGSVQPEEISYDKREKSEMISSDMVQSAPMMQDSAYVETDKRVIKNGDLSLRVGSADKAAGEISNIVKQKGGEVFSTNFYEAVKGQKSGFLTVRVPVDKFDETIGDIKKIATQVISESTNGQDVTEQYTDLQAQLKNKKAEEESFVKILGTAGKIDDVLAATREVARVRGEIERLEGRIRFMDSQTDMSTITVNLTEDTTIVPINEGWRPWQVVKQSIKELVAGMQNFADGIIRFVIVGIPSLIPFALLVGFLYWAGKKIFKKISA